VSALPPGPAAAHTGEPPLGPPAYTPPGPSVRLGAPETPADTTPNRRDTARFDPAPEQKLPKISIDEERDKPNPVDIPAFAFAKPKVGSAQKPFNDGFDWLKAKKYKTALHIHGAGVDTAAAKKQFQKAGLRYLDLEVSPASLNEEIIDNFDKIVTDADNLPLFVYDEREGLVLGGLWYLHFRRHEKMTDEKARYEAAKLGFKDNGTDDYKDMALAVQNLLKKTKP
jgi:hypothetical protein